jgi:RimJ/RimL family protein N-acetyltransferase
MFTIKKITPKHIDGFHYAVDAVARERKYLTFLEAPPLKAMRAFVLNNIKTGNPQFVAIAEGNIIGWCDILRSEWPTHAHRGTLGMGLLPSFRGLGIGMNLIRATLDDARHKGLVRIELTVHADNERAIRLYNKVGFQKEGLMRDAVCIDGRYIDSILMALVHRT